MKRGARGSAQAKIYYDARGREMAMEGKRGKRELRWTEGKGEQIAIERTRTRDGKREQQRGVSR